MATLTYQTKRAYNLARCRFARSVAARSPDLAPVMLDALREARAALLLARMDRNESPLSTRAAGLDFIGFQDGRHAAGTLNANPYRRDCLQYRAWNKGVAYQTALDSARLPCSEFRRALRR